MASEQFDPQDWREWRRMQAWRLKQLGWKQRDIAVALDVTEGAVSPWMATARSEGPAALLARIQSKAPGNTSSMSRCATWSASTWKNSIWNFTWPSAA
jgi:transposase